MASIRVYSMCRRTWTSPSPCGWMTDTHTHVRSDFKCCSVRRYPLHEKKHNDLPMQAYANYSANQNALGSMQQRLLCIFQQNPCDRRSWLITEAYYSSLLLATVREYLTYGKLPLPEIWSISKHSTCPELWLRCHINGITAGADISRRWTPAAEKHTTHVLCNLAWEDESFSSFALRVQNCYGKKYRPL